MKRAALWIGLTVTGFFVGGTALHFPGTLDDVGFGRTGLVLGGVTGLVVGSLQLVALRGIARPLWAWPLATAAGTAITHALGDGLPQAGGYLWVALGGGLALGVFQAAVLRTPAWVPAVLLSFVIGIVGGYQLAFAIGFNSRFEQDALARQVAMNVATGVAFALLTWPILARIRASYTRSDAGASPTPKRSGRNS